MLKLSYKEEKTQHFNKRLCDDDSLERQVLSYIISGFSSVSRIPDLGSGGQRGRVANPDLKNKSLNNVFRRIWKY